MLQPPRWGSTPGRTRCSCCPPPRSPSPRHGWRADSPPCPIPRALSPAERRLNKCPDTMTSRGRRMLLLLFHRTQARTPPITNAKLATQDSGCRPFVLVGTEVPVCMTNRIRYF